MHLVSWSLIQFAFSLEAMATRETYPFEEPRGVDVDGTAPLRHRYGPVLVLGLAHDLAVHKDRDQGALWEAPHIGLGLEMGQKFQKKKFGTLALA